MKNEFVLIGNFLQMRSNAVIVQKVSFRGTILIASRILLLFDTMSAQALAVTRMMRSLLDFEVCFVVCAFFFGAFMPV